MSHPTFHLTFPHGLRPNMPMSGSRVPSADEVLVLDGERWIVNSVEWQASGDDRYAVRPTLHMRPSWGLLADLRALAANHAPNDADNPDGNVTSDEE